MKLSSVFVLFICLTGLFHIPIQAQSHSGDILDMGQFRWEKRLLLIFTPELTDLKTIEVMNAFEKNKAGIIDRDVLLFYIFENGQSTYGDSLLNEKSVKFLRQKYYAANGTTTVVLIAKDGGEKYRQVDHIDVQRIFDRIDRLPMRISEVEDRSFSFDSIKYDQQ